VTPPVIADSLLRKLREGAYEGRRKAQAAPRENEMKLWSLMWTHMSPQSQSNIREDSTFEQACLELDSAQLWILIKRSHLTHVYGDEDTMAVVNIHDQALRYSNMRQTVYTVHGITVYGFPLPDAGIARTLYNHPSHITWSIDTE
jgi:hypothetical protein